MTFFDRMRVSSFFLLTVVLLACDPKPTSPNAPEASSTSSASGQPPPEPPASALAALHADTGVTTEPLAAFCKYSPCDPYDRALQQMRARAARSPDAGMCFVAEHGTCGELRYLDEIEGGLMGVIRYFDGRGTLIAVMQYNIEHPGSRWSGPQQSCQRKPDADLCQPRK